MGILDDTAIFYAIIHEGSFSRAARALNLSNGLISRRVAKLEECLGVTLLRRTTRQLSLTPEGEIFLKHSQRIQQELDAALTFMQSSAKRPKGRIRISAPTYFGRHYLTPMIMQFLSQFEGIQVDLILNNKPIDLIKENIDLAVRGTGYIHGGGLQDSSLHMKLLCTEKIGLYASPLYLQKYSEPKQVEDLRRHRIINHINDKYLRDEAEWSYTYRNKKGSVLLRPSFNCNDIESALIGCQAGHGIGRFTDFNVKGFLQQQVMQPILRDYTWGEYQLFIVYSYQKALPKRSRLLLDFIAAQCNKITLQVSTSIANTP